MNRRQELCRDFLRGNCRYGDRCKYLHQLPQQQQQRQQQQRNEFGGGDNYYHALGNNAIYSNQRQPQNQSPSKEHSCNDPRICKEQIKEDFANEHPAFWRLTCYAHYKFLPNDIVGDVSPEELRALAYEGAKQGLSLKDVAQREASMVAEKSLEFAALLRNPYKSPAALNSQGSQSQSLASSRFLSPPQKSGPVMPFGQVTNLSTASPAQVFAQPPFAGTPGGSFNFSQPSGDVEFGKPKQSTSMSSGNPSPFGMQTSLFQQNPFGGVASPSPASRSPFPNPQGPNAAVHSNAFPSPFSSPLGSAMQPALPVVQSPPAFASPVVSSTSPQLQVAMKTEIDPIWLKDVWKIGEIPEEEPPPEVRF